VIPSHDPSRISRLRPVWRKLPSLRGKSPRVRGFADFYQRFFGETPSQRTLAAMSWRRPNIGSRMNREVHVRVWERAEVKFLRATRQLPALPRRSIAGCCALAANGHAAAPPRRLMNSRRRISAPKLRGQHCSARTRYLGIGLKPGIKTIAAVHSQCRRWVKGGRSGGRSAPGPRGPDRPSKRTGRSATEGLLTGEILTRRRLACGALAMITAAAASKTRRLWRRRCPE
jgi:hypothetical protein